jgi:hypothetical protein
MAHTFKIENMITTQFWNERTAGSTHFKNQQTPPFFEWVVIWHFQTFGRNIDSISIQVLCFSETAVMNFKNHPHKRMDGVWMILTQHWYGPSTNGLYHITMSQTWDEFRVLSWQWAYYHLWHVLKFSLKSLCLHPISQQSPKRGIILAYHCVL